MQLTLTDYANIFNKDREDRGRKAMRIIFRFLKKYRAAALVAVGLMFIELMIELLQPYMIAKIIDEGIAASNLQIVMLWGGILLACTAVSFGSGILSSFYSAHVSQSFGYDLREKLYEKVQALTFSSFNRFAEASLITRLTNDIVQLQNTVFMGLRIMLRAPLFVLGSVVFSLIINFKLAIWFAAAIPFLFVFLVWVMKRGEALFRLVQQKVDHVNSVLQQNLMGIRLVRLFLRSKYEEGRFSSTTSELKDRTVSAMKLTELALPVILFVMNISVLLILWFGRAQLELSEASAGEVVAVVNYAIRTTGILSIMSMIVVNFSRARASGLRIEEVMEAEEETAQAGLKDSSKKNAQGEIKFEQVSFRYPETNERTLSEISFHARPGETIAIMGATGSGKTSLLQLLPRLFEIEEGSILIDGRNIQQLKLHDVRSGIGFVPQELILFSGTIADNIRWGKKEASMEEVIEAAKLAQIHDTIMQLPKQYDTWIGQMGVNLSGGQKQRVTIARAIIRKPSILLLDDSTSALDANTERALLTALKQIKCTILLVTQKISTNRNADHILLLDDGKLLEQGTHELLLEKSKLYRHICESQQSREELKHA